MRERETFTPVLPHVLCLSPSKHEESHEERERERGDPADVALSCGGERALLHSLSHSLTHSLTHAFSYPSTLSLSPLSFLPFICRLLRHTGAHTGSSVERLLLTLTHRLLLMLLFALTAFDERVVLLHLSHALSLLAAAALFLLP